MKGLEGDRTSVLTRKSRRHYGTCISEEFCPGVHLESDAYIDRCLATKQARNQMRWLVHKGQDMDTSRETHTVVEVSVAFLPGDSRWVRVNLMACDLNISPSRATEVSQKLPFKTLLTLISPCTKSPAC
jgi:hypothetical protein